MLGTVKIGNQEIEMLANGATPFWFNQIFHEDFFTNATKGLDSGATANVFSRVGFVMMKQAEGADMKKVNEGQFMAWLAEFNPQDVPDAIADIVDLYMEQEKTTAKPKK